jgi:hypothetical protein
MDDDRHSWSIVPDLLVAIERAGGFSAQRMTDSPLSVDLQTRCAMALS